MRREAIYKFLQALGEDDFTESNQWINTECCLAPYTHGGGVDQRPSLGISVNDEGPSVYWCFGCSPEGKRLDWLLHNIFIMSGAYPWEAAKIFAEEEIHTKEEKNGDEVPELFVQRKQIVYKPLPSQVLRKFPLLQSGKGFEARRCKEFLERERGVPEWVQNMLRVRYDERKSAVVFGMTDIKGNTFVLRERSRRRKSMWTVSENTAKTYDIEWPSLRHAGVWFGMFLVDWRRPVMLVEGEIDVLRIGAFGYPTIGRSNVIASATSAVSDAQIDALAPARTLILGFDADKGGEFACRRVIDRIGDKANLLRARWDMVHNGKGVPCKDPGDLPGSASFELVMADLEVIG